MRNTSRRSSRAGPDRANTSHERWLWASQRERHQPVGEPFPAPPQRTDAPPHLHTAGAIGSADSGPDCDVSGDSGATGAETIGVGAGVAAAFRDRYGYVTRRSRLQTACVTGSDAR